MFLHSSRMESVEQGISQVTCVLSAALCPQPRPPSPMWAPHSALAEGESGGAGGQTSCTPTDPVCMSNFCLVHTQEDRSLGNLAPKERFYSPLVFCIYFFLALLRYN